MAFLYSVRVSRWKGGSLPGSGLILAAASSFASKCEATASYVAASGRGRPAGGIAPVRSFRTTFSQAAASAPGSSAFSFSSANPPACTFSLWQVAQYLLRVAVFVAVLAGDAGGRGLGACCVRRSLDAPNTRATEKTAVRYCFARIVLRFIQYKGCRSEGQ